MYALIEKTTQSLLKVALPIVIAELLAKKSPAISHQDVTRLLRHLASLLTAGIPLLAALDIIYKSQTRSALNQLLESIRSDLEHGLNLATALGRHPHVFDELCRSLVASGEQAGVLEFLLDKLAHYRENLETLKNKVRKAMLYPLGVLVLSLTVTTVLLIWVIPTFEDLYKSFASRLPTLTRMIIDLSKLVQSYGASLFIAMVLTGFMTASLFRQSQGLQWRWQKLQLRLPIMGSILKKSALARMALTLGTLCSARVPLTEALTTVAGVCGNPLFHHAILRLRDDISTGYPLQLAMQQSPLFPPLVIQMIAIGESSGTLDSMLFKIADYYSAEVSYQVDQLTSLIEPLMMIILGLLIGGLILSMYLPIFSLGSVIG